MFHRDGRSVDALLTHMTKRRIWDVEGRVRGTNLENNKFQFDFDKEEDLQKVLQRRPCHFNKWTFSLERWVPTINENFPNTLVLWVSVVGIPTHYKKDESYRSIGNALGEVDTVDVEGERIRVFINADERLQFERRAGYANGDVIKVTLKYEELHRYCFTCKRISHEEGTCPQLTPKQRETNRLRKIVEKEKEEQAAKEAFSYKGPVNTKIVDRESEGQKIAPHQRSNPSRRSLERHAGYGYLRRTINEKCESSGKVVWNRLEGKYKEKYGEGYDNKFPRNQERYHPYQDKVSEYRSKRFTDRENQGYTGSYYGSSSEWRVKDSRPLNKVIKKRTKRGEYSSRTRRNSRLSTHSLGYSPLQTAGRERERKKTFTYNENWITYGLATSPA